MKWNQAMRGVASTEFVVHILRKRIPQRVSLEKLLSRVVFRTTTRYIAEKLRHAVYHYINSTKIKDLFIISTCSLLHFYKTGVGAGSQNDRREKFSGAED